MFLLSPFYKGRILTVFIAANGFFINFAESIADTHLTGSSDSNGEIKSFYKTTNMGRNKYSEKEIKEIGKLLRLKNSANRAKQKEIRHTLRTEFEFNISDFNEPGKAFGDNELNEAIKRGAIRILDEATIEAMKEKRARDKAKDEKEKQQQAIEAGEQTDWQQAMKEWKEWKEEKDGEK